jgi:spore germination cell wall hydrolase CwlJ-like protein
MTALFSEKEIEIDVHDLNLFSVLASIMLISCALFFAGFVLHWAVNDKFSKFEILEPSDITAELRTRQLECLARNIYYEAGIESFEGKVAVAQVTLNRVEHEDFPKDVCQVVYQKNKVYQKIVCQFSWYCDRPARLRPIDQKTFDESMIVAKKVLLEGFRLPSLTEAIYYHADYVNPGWKKQRITKIGRHIFYKG